MSKKSSGEALHQKGANGLIAEYQCALQLVRLLEEHRIPVRQTAAAMLQTLRQQEAKYTAELSSAQIQRAENQGTALGSLSERNLRNDRRASPI